MYDLSGGLEAAGKPMYDVLNFAVDEMNAAGGLLGREIKVVSFDTQTNMQLYAQYAQEAALKNKVAVVHGGITSASREVIRPVLDKYKTLYFYDMPYEGGVCDRNPPISVGIIGIILERLIIRHLYGRMVETMLATWGLSLFVVGILTMIFGDITEGVPTPLPGIRIGAYQTSGYSLFVIALSVVTLFGVYVILRSSRLGLLARGTMQNAEMAAALGTDTSRIYAVTFAFGAALAGLAGGVLAPVSGVFPTLGGSYIGRAFITVISGGAAPLAGTASASILFGVINQIATFLTNPVYGEVALLLTAIVLIRILPQGITGRYLRGSL